MSDRPAVEVCPAASAVQAVLARARSDRPRIIAIDGPSGSGKSTLADAVLRARPGRTPELVRLDDVYRGWTGLERAGSDLSRTLIARRSRGAIGQWQRWDWASDRPGSTESSSPGAPLIIEGCGAFAAVARVDALRVWVEAPARVRKRRALARDDGAFDPYWELWERQWRRYVARTEPARQADVRVRVVGG